MGSNLHLAACRRPRGLRLLAQWVEAGAIEQELKNFDKVTPYPFHGLMLSPR